ncbi:MAG: hypothetical protein M3Y13_00810, partial [Armatimonadota bacterium]|nr:hypothetical protein [Armatimonadota bacterium]
HVSKMDDMVRGRINLPDAESVQRVSEAFEKQTRFEATEIIGPRVDKATGIVRYPRHHIILRDRATGITHEWQIGTQAATDLYEKKGIAVPEALSEAAKKLDKHFNPDIHDVEYDLFQAINKKHPEIAAKYGIPEYVKEVAKASDQAGREGVNLPGRIESLHHEASAILAKLVHGQGAEWVAHFFH